MESETAKEDKPACEIKTGAGARGAVERISISTPNGDAELLYKVNGNVMSIFHTFVPDAERGKGIAEKMAYAAFDLAKKKGLKIRPDCPYITHFLEKHSEFNEMIA
jgi:predicted GNAT family acetyltransferase